jgi:hypothetical protein
MACVCPEFDHIKEASDMCEDSAITGLAGPSVGIEDSRTGGERFAGEPCPEGEEAHS